MVPDVKATIGLLKTLKGLAKIGITRTFIVRNVKTGVYGCAKEFLDDGPHLAWAKGGFDVYNAGCDITLSISDYSFYSEDDFKMEFKTIVSARKLEKTLAQLSVDELRELLPDEL